MNIRHRLQRRRFMRDLARELLWFIPTISGLTLFAALVFVSIGR